jgi:hypothetical protein
MIHKNFLVLPVILLLVLGACTNDPLDVDISGQRFDTSFIDMHNPLYHSDSAELFRADEQFRKEIADIYAYFRGYCFRVGEVRDTAFYNSVLLYRADRVMQQVDSSINALFSNKTEIEKNLSNAFKHLYYHFPKGKKPEHIVYMNSFYLSSVFCTEKEIGIGLERYLGADNSVVKNLDPSYFFQWVKNGMNPDFLERDVLEGWIETHYVEEVDGNLAEGMVRAGKVLYLVEASFPDWEKHIVLRYNADQLKWAEENEYGFWKYLVDENLLFETNERNATNILKPGPTTSGLPIAGSPDRMGCYLGWKMVHAYMKENEVSLKELINTPYSKILKDYEIE